MSDFGFTGKEFETLKKLSTPFRVQVFLDTEIKYNGSDGDCFSPRFVLKKRKACCLDAATFAAVALRIQGFRPLILDLCAVRDEDHVLAVFKKNGCWGAVAKSKYLGLRYREPVYASIRELVMSYFNHYYNWNGERTLRSYSSKPLDLSRFDSENWMTTKNSLWFLEEYLEKLPHKKVISKKQECELTKVEFPRYRREMQVLPKNLKEKRIVLGYKKKPF
jgi:hypothetical protein